MREYASMEEFFSVLNEIDNYVVLRNYENFLDAGVLKEHPDIDVLCQSAKELNIHMQTIPRLKKQDDIHRKVLIAGKEVPVDVREVGDGYYDTNWEKSMLKNKKMYKDTFYVIEETEYFYSLLYHALIHKYQVSPDYVMKLDSMSSQLNIELNGENRIAVLEAYMKEQGYKYTYPEYIKGIFNIVDTNEEMIEKNSVRRLKRKMFNLVFAMKEIIKNGRKN